jgi:hypothetical protein
MLIYQRVRYDVIAKGTLFGSEKNPSLFLKVTWYWIKAMCDVLSGEYSMRSTGAGMSCQV